MSSLNKTRILENDEQKKTNPNSNASFELGFVDSLKRPRKNTWALFYAYFTLILMGPTGAGKTHLSVALGIHAVERGYKVSFVSMNQLMYILKTKEYINKSKIRYKRIIASDLIIIDDVMYMTYETQEANLFFQFIYDLYDKAAFILTSNKGPNEWGGSTSSFWTQKD